jgi:hypothetical protein
VKELIHPGAGGGNASISTQTQAQQGADTAGGAGGDASEAGESTAGEQSSSLNSGGLGAGELGNAQATNANAAAVAQPDTSGTTSVGAAVSESTQGAGDAGNVSAGGATNVSPAASSVTAPAAALTGASTASLQLSALTPQTLVDTDNTGNGAASSAATGSANAVQSSAGTATLGAGTPAAPAGEHVTLLERWYHEMSKVGRGLSGETEKLLRETGALLGL